MEISDRKLQYKAYSVADQIDLKSFKAITQYEIISSSSSELYLQVHKGQYIYLFSYGAVVLSNFSNNEEATLLNSLKDLARGWKPIPLNEEIQAIVNEDKPLDVSFEVLTVQRLDHDVNKMIMFSLAQSVTLQHYNDRSQYLLSEINEYTDVMRVRGKIKLHQKGTLKFIGKMLSTKNNIAENLYILDIPETAWEDEYIDKLLKNLSAHFEISQRHRAIENTLKIIEDNLSVFISYHRQRESSRLEWIIIILIVIEVVDALISKIL